MLSFIRKRITFANVAMTVALVFAMTGGAFAAHSKAKHAPHKPQVVITSIKQISKSVLEALKGQIGPVGPAGPTGTNGTPGAKGETGTPGLNGVNGESVTVKSVNPGNATCKEGGTEFSNKSGTGFACAGKAGESVTIKALPKGDPNCKEGGAEFSNNTGQAFACNGEAGTGGATCLTSGKTEEGQWAIFQTVTAENLGKGIRTPVSFTTPLCEGVTVTPIFVAAGEPTPAHCKGEVSKPEAEPGYLCVFATFEEELTFVSFQSAETQNEETRGSGTILVLKSTAEAPNARAIGDWAVTAP